MKNTRRFVVIAVLLTVTALLLGLSSCRKPSQTPLDYLNDVWENSFPAAEAAPLEEPILTELIFNGTEDTDLLAPGLRLKLQSYASSQGAAFLVDGSFSGMTVDLKAYADKTAFAIGSECLLGSSVYGMDLTKAKENFENSLFADPDSELYLGKDFLTELSTSLTPDTALVDLEADLKAALAKYLDLLQTALTEYECTAMTDNEHGGKTVTVTLTEESTEKLIRGFYQTAKKDTALRDLIEDYLTYVYASLEGEGDDFISDAMEEYDDFFASDDVLDDFLDELSENEFTLTFVAETNTEDAIVAASLTFDATLDGEWGKIVVSFDGSDENEVRFTIDIDGSAEDDEEALSFETLSLVLETEEDEESFAQTLSLEVTSGMKITMELYGLTYEKETGAYTLNLAKGLFGGQPITLSGIFESDDEGTTLTITKLDVPMAAEYVGKTSFALDLRLSAKTVDSIPAVPAYTEVLTMTEEDITSLGEAVLASPLGQFLASLDNPYEGDAWEDVR